MNNKEDKLKTELHKILVLSFKEYNHYVDRNGVKKRTEKKIQDWINTHYISRDKVERLKMKHKSKSNFSGQMDTWDYEPENRIIDEINQKIKEILK